MKGIIPEVTQKLCTGSEGLNKTAEKAISYQEKLGWNGKAMVVSAHGHCGS